MDAKSVLTTLAAICTIAMFLTGIKVCQKIRLQGNTQNVSIMPFLCTFINCTIWLKYGLLKGDGLMTYVNGAGMVLEGIFLMVYYIHVIEKDTEDGGDPLMIDRVHRSLLYGGFMLYSLLLYVKFYLEDLESSLSTLGTVGILTCIVMFGSPLAMIGQVCRTKSTDSLPFSTSLSMFIVSLEWLMYGHLVSDFYIEFPNFMGVVLGLVQLLMFVWYPNTPPHVKGSTGPTSTV